MMAIEFRRQLHELKFTAGMNCRYHQWMQWAWETIDLASRIAVFVFALLDLVASASGHGSLVFSAFAFGLAAVLIILASDRRSRKYNDWFRRWCLLRGEVEDLERKTTSLADDNDVATVHLGTLNKLQDTATQIHANEAAAWNLLLNRCYADELQSHYGGSVRTFEQALEENQRRQQAAAAS